MSTSGSYDFSMTRNDVIRTALGYLGNTTVQAAEYEDASTQLNMLLKHWAATKGFKLWKREEIELTLIPGTQSYALGPDGTPAIQRPLEISNVRYVVGNTETPVQLCSLQEYKELTDKTTQGVIVQAHYQPTLTNGTLYVWPTGDVETDTLKFTSRTQVQDMDEPLDDFDFPQEWYLAITWNLAKQLSTGYGVDPQTKAEVRENAATYLAEIEWSDQEHTSLFFQPEYR